MSDILLDYYSGDVAGITEHVDADAKGKDLLASIKRMKQLSQFESGIAKARSLVYITAMEDVYTRLYKKLEKGKV